MHHIGDRKYDIQSPLAQVISDDEAQFCVKAMGVCETTAALKQVLSVPWIKGWGHISKGLFQSVKSETKIKLPEYNEYNSKLKSEMYFAKKISPEKWAINSDISPS